MRTKDARRIRVGIYNARAIFGKPALVSFAGLADTSKLRDRAFIREYNKLSRKHLNNFATGYINAIVTGRLRADSR